MNFRLCLAPPVGWSWSCASSGRATHDDNDRQRRRRRRRKQAAVGGWSAGASCEMGEQHRN